MRKLSIFKILTLFIILLVSNNLKAQVSLINSGTGTSTTFNYSVASGTNRFLYAIVTAEFSAANNVSSLVYGGKTMIASGVTSVTQGGNVNDVAIYYLRESDFATLSGTTATIGYTNGTGSLKSVGTSFFLFQHVDQISPIDQIKGNTKVNNTFISSNSNINTSINDVAIAAVNSSDLSTISVSSGFNIINNVTLSQHSYATAIKFITSIGPENPVFTMAVSSPSLAYSALRIRWDNVPLSVDFLNIMAQKRDKNIYLKWSTANEINNAGFSIERSADGKNFIKIGEEKNSAKNVVYKNYSFLDTRPFVGTNYYRIAQHDFDGKINYSKLVSISNGNELVKNLILFPNPALDLVYFNYNSDAEDKINVTVFDLTGKLLIQKHYIVSAKSTTEIELNLESLTRGMYLISTENEQGIKTSNRIVKR